MNSSQKDGGSNLLLRIKVVQATDLKFFYFQYTVPHSCNEPVTKSATTRAKIEHTAGSPEIIEMRDNEAHRADVAEIHQSGMPQKAIKF